MQRAEIESQNYNAIDLVKFVCAILVVTIHVAPLGDTETINMISYINFGIQQYLSRVAVPFFFVASGFFLYKKTSASDFNPEYSKKYILRMLRLYALWSLIYLPMAIYSFFKDESGLLHALVIYARNIIFTGSYRHLWYLNALIVAVAIISFLLYIKIKPQKLIIFAAAFYFAGLFAQSWFGFIIPLREHAPKVWHMLKLLENVIVTTRDGLFEGFFFVAMGMCFAFLDIRIGKKKALIGFLISMILLLFEIAILQYFHYIREYDMYLFLAPATFFLFCFVRQAEIPDRPIFKTLRKLSALIFYTHIWVISVILNIICKSLSKTCLPIILTLSLTIAGALIVIRLSEHPKFKWLRHLYT